MRFLKLCVDAQNIFIKVILLYKFYLNALSKKSIAHKICMNIEEVIQYINLTNKKKHPV